MTNTITSQEQANDARDFSVNHFHVLSKVGFSLLATILLFIVLIFQNKHHKPLPFSYYTRKEVITAKRNMGNLWKNHLLTSP